MPKKTTKKVTKKPAKTKKVEQAVAPTAAPVVFGGAPVSAPPTAKLESQKIWEEIHMLPIDMFALPNQVVSQHCEPLPFVVDPNRLFLTIRSTATLPSLETSLNAYSSMTKMHAAEMAKRGRVSEVKEYAVELADKFVIVSRAAPSLTGFAKK